MAKAGDLLSLRDDSARWLWSRGIEQWDVGEVSLATYVRSASAGELQVVRDNGHVIAGLRLAWSDEEIWADAAPAAYVHGLVVARTHAGNGLGAALLSWVAERSTERGADLVRLDCVAANTELCAYYRRLGFVGAGLRDFGPDSRWRPVHRFEKRVGTASA